jgi:hypothetical protein
MTSKILIDREILERLANIGRITTGSSHRDSLNAVPELRALLAAPEAPRQDAIGTLKRIGQNIIFDVIGDPHIRDGMEVFTAPLSPDHSGGGAGVVLTELCQNFEAVMDFFSPGEDRYNRTLVAARDCLDRAKGINK